MKDGTAAPELRVDNEAIAGEISAALSQTAAQFGSDKCASGVATRSDAVTDSTSFYDNNGSPPCQRCYAGCFVLAFTTGVAVAAVCTFVCPVCFALCAVGALAAGLGTLYLCYTRCAEVFCTNHGPRCGKNRDGSEYLCPLGGDTCIDASQGRCCPHATEACGTVCCESANNEACGRDTNTGSLRCCIGNHGEELIDGQCCLERNIHTTPDGKRVCCEGSRVCADGTCCVLGECRGGSCCAKPCGQICCNGADQCIGAPGSQTCCSATKQCGGGSVCCAGDTICLDDATGTCGPPPLCPDGQTPQRDPAGGVSCCSVNTPGAACNGGCCVPGEQCCGTPLACSTDCIR